MSDTISKKSGSSITNYKKLFKSVGESEVEGEAFEASMEHSFSKSKNWKEFISGSDQELVKYKSSPSAIKAKRKIRGQLGLFFVLAISFWWISDHFIFRQGPFDGISSINCKLPDKVQLSSEELGAYQQCIDQFEFGLSTWTRFVIAPVSKSLFFILTFFLPWALSSIFFRPAARRLNQVVTRYSICVTLTFLLIFLGNVFLAFGEGEPKRLLGLAVIGVCTWGVMKVWNHQFLDY